MKGLERLLSVLLVVAALVIAVSVARRELFNASASAEAAGVVGQALTYEKDWGLTLQVGVILGDPAALVHLIQFADLECSACRNFETEVLPAVRERYRDKLALTYVHFPLPRHRFSRIAAQAAECAGYQGRFHSFVSAVYAQQDSIGLRLWSRYALDAGVADTLQFGTCLLTGTPTPRVDAGFELGQHLNVRGTPTVFVNGWRFRTPPSLAELTRTITELLDGRRPSLAVDSDG